MYLLLSVFTSFVSSEMFPPLVSMAGLNINTLLVGICNPLPQTTLELVVQDTILEKEFLRLVCNCPPLVAFRGTS